MITKEYSLEQILARAREQGITGEEDLLRIKWAYIDTELAYESNIPYKANKQPGIMGAIEYLNNKRIIAYTSATKETNKILQKKGLI